MRFSEQVKLYAWAEVVVAAHGAALANSLFMRPGAEVVEIVQDCRKSRRSRRLRMLQPWTGWHAPFLDLTVSYVACDAAEGHTMQGDRAVMWVDGNKVLGNRYQYDRTSTMKDVLEKVEPAIRRVKAQLDEEASRDETEEVNGRGRLKALMVHTRRMELGAYFVLPVLVVVLFSISMGRSWFGHFRKQKEQVGFSSMS